MSFQEEWDKLASDVHETATQKGWWEIPRENGTAIALMHSELSEALEADRVGNPLDEKCPEHSAVAVELADVVIRIMDFSKARNLDIGAAIEAKANYNKDRSYRHGGKDY